MAAKDKKKLTPKAYSSMDKLIKNHKVIEAE